eukprot:Platyproteum_vivax@DN7087_c0_g1_i2.p1
MDKQTVLPQFGLHPWWLDEMPAEWKPQLIELLREHPQAGVGEIGLDKSKSNKIQFSLQKEVFTEQLEIANSLQRTASIHCVGGCFVAHTVGSAAGGDGQSVQ